MLRGGGYIVALSALRLCSMFAGCVKVLVILAVARLNSVQHHRHWPQKEPAAITNRRK